MNRDETVELFLKGSEAWNAWANALLAERKAMEEAGAWKSHRPLYVAREKGENLETQVWLDKAFADLSYCHFLVREGAADTAGEMRSSSPESDSASKSTKESPCSRPSVNSVRLEACCVDFKSFLFPSDASFEGAAFTGSASFDRAAFTGNAWFDHATFARSARFDGATFTGEVSLQSAAFTGNAQFDSAVYTGDVWFLSATFAGGASFSAATFAGRAAFANATFACNAIFAGTHFKDYADFNAASFKQYASFASARFGEASFYAVRGERGFDMADAVFETGVPNFILAHFEEAPLLDSMKVLERWAPPPYQPPKREDPGKTRQALWDAARRAAGSAMSCLLWALESGWQRKLAGSFKIPARWRALKRLAIQGHDTERELEYHARELQSQRFESDWPLPLKPWNGASWAGALRFWFGLFYGVTSDFGRSIIRPFLLWWATVAVFAMYFLAGQPYVEQLRQADPPHGLGGSATAYVQLVPALWSDPPRCYAGALAMNGQPDAELTGLAGPVWESTNALREAFRLAIRNGSVILDGGGDAMRRTYGCLYGIERSGGNAAPFVPGFVTDASGIQKVLSALYIFLFGLALRNMLKMK